LLFNLFAPAIKLYVQLAKDRLILQAKVDVAQEVDMHIRVKQLGANMRLQVVIVLRPFFDFMDSFKLSTTHNMLAFMLDPRFKDLSLVENWLGFCN